MAKGLTQLVSDFSRLKVVVVGDLILDRYIWGKAEFISPEAPVPLVRARREEMRLGGAGFVARNIRALGGSAAVVGFVGTDAGGASCRALLEEAGINYVGTVKADNRPTMVKTRVIAGAKQVVRVDWETPDGPSEEESQRLFDAFRSVAADADLVCVSDHAKGTLSCGITSRIAGYCRDRGTVCLADTAPEADFRKYAGATTMTPNRMETTLATGIVPGDSEAIRRAADKLLGECSLDSIFITLDVDGIAYLSAEGEFDVLPTQARAVFDVTGAGDVVATVVGAALACGAPLRSTARLANLAAGLSVERLGAATVTAEELIAHIMGSGGVFARKVVSWERLADALRQARRSGARIVFTNGCFDILHPGHVKLLEFCRAQGDIVVIGLNSDESVRRLKGEDRPVLDQNERAHCLAALEMVDYVAVFEEDTPARLVEQVRPDVMVKGEDWRGRKLAGAEFVRSYGGRIEFAELMKDISTTAIIGRMASDQEGE